MVDEVGEGVTSWEMGQEVVAVVDNIGSYGAYSEYVVVPAVSVAKKPAGLSFVEAASYPMNSLTARTILDTLSLPKGAVLAVTGGPGALGSYVIQLATNEGVKVIADAADKGVELLGSFGASEIVARGDGVADRIREKYPDGVDAVVDCALLHDAITPAIRDGGQMAVLRGGGGEPGRGITVHRINVRNSVKNQPAIIRLAEQVESGLLAIRVAKTFPADQAADAHAMIDQSGVRGRIVLTF